MIDFTCPNCDTYYILWDETMPAITAARHNDLSEVVRKQYDEIGSCKFCVSKDPNIPTTAEMDGLRTTIDMKERFFIMKKCQPCSKFTRQDLRKKSKPCDYCGSTSFDLKSSKSLRTYNEFLDNKKTRKKR